MADAGRSTKWLRMHLSRQFDHVVASREPVGSRLASSDRREFVPDASVYPTTQRRGAHRRLAAKIPARWHHEASFVDWSNEAHAIIEQEETCPLVRRCIDQLPDSYRTVLLMHDIEGIPVDEVAAVLDISSNAVHIRLHRAQFDRHLSACPNCRAYLATYRATIELSRRAFAIADADAQTEVPAELVTAILIRALSSSNQYSGPSADRLQADAWLPGGAA
jgi:sigma-70-like protein